eukprot:ANDGO_04387.mRNA.1 Laminin-like protein epi-1
MSFRWCDYRFLLLWGFLHVCLASATALLPSPNVLYTSDSFNATAGIWRDKSGCQNDGQTVAILLSQSTQGLTGVPSSFTQFNGQSSRVSVPGRIKCMQNGTNQNFTVVFHAQLNSLSGASPSLWMLGRSSTDIDGESIWRQDYYWEYPAPGVRNFVFSPAVSFSNRWMSIAIVRNMTHFSYFQGSEFVQVNVSLTPISNRAADMFLGFDGRDNLGYMKANVSLFAMFNQSLTSSEINYFLRRYVPCPDAGQFSDPLSFLCQNCSDGFQPNPNRTACFVCPAGYYSNSSTMYTCQLCPIRSFSYPGAARCSFCPSNFFATNRTRCDAVWGEVAENGITALSAPASTNFTSVFFASYGTPTGSQGIYGIGACHAATSVTVVSAIALGRSSATIPASNAAFGDPCSGTVKRLYVAIKFSACPAGYMLVVNSSTVTCEQCGVGKSVDTDSQVCVSCSSSSYSNATTGYLCSMCPVGHQSLGDRCQFCQNGQYSNASTALKCIPCPPGFSSDSTRASCVPCVSSFYSNASTLFQCTLCPEGYETTYASSQCETCAANQYSNASTNFRCSFCPPGSGATQSRTQCVDCAVGTYSNASTSFACTACRIGFGVSQSKSSCEACVGSSVSNLQTNFSCVSCPDGMEPLSNRSACTVCAPGFYSNQSTVNRCVWCPLGHIASALRDSCDRCPDGAISNGSHCEMCPAGHIVSENANNCSACASGTQPSSSKMACEPCSVGSFSNASTLFQCTLCPEGYETTYASSQCVTCAANQYSNASTNFRCSFCPPGSGATQSRTQCVDCAVGTYSNASTSFVCVECGNDRTPFSNRSQCRSCDANQFSNAGTGFVCLTCFPGSEPALDRSGCQNCSSGKYSNSTTGFVCATCPSGTEPSVHADHCISCNQSYYSNATTGWKCMPCPFGRTTSDTPHVSCERCLPNFFGRACTGCPPCENGGVCRDGAEGNGTCWCPASYSGTTCSSCSQGYFLYPYCNISCSSSTNCSGRGTCESDSGLCVCFEGWTAADCSEKILPPDTNLPPQTGVIGDALQPDVMGSVSSVSTIGSIASGPGMLLLVGTMELVTRFSYLNLQFPVWYVKFAEGTMMPVTSWTFNFMTLSSVRDAFGIGDEDVDVDSATNLAISATDVLGTYSGLCMQITLCTLAAAVGFGVLDGFIHTVLHFVIRRLRKTRWRHMSLEAQGERQQKVLLQKKCIFASVYFVLYTSTVQALTVSFFNQFFSFARDTQTFQLIFISFVYIVFIAFLPFVWKSVIRWVHGLPENVLKSAFAFEALKSNRSWYPVLSTTLSFLDAVLVVPGIGLSADSQLPLIMIVSLCRFACTAVLRPHRHVRDFWIDILVYASDFAQISLVYSVRSSRTRSDTSELGKYCLFIAIWQAVTILFIGAIAMIDAAKLLVEEVYRLILLLFATTRDPDVKKDAEGLSGIHPLRVPGLPSQKKIFNRILEQQIVPASPQAMDRSPLGTPVSPMPPIIIKHSKITPNSSERPRTNSLNPLDARSLRPDNVFAGMLFQRVRPLEKPRAPIQSPP